MSMLRQILGDNAALKGQISYLTKYVTMLNTKVGQVDSKIADLTKAARTDNSAPANTTSTPEPATVQAAATTLQAGKPTAVMAMLKLSIQKKDQPRTTATAQAAAQHQLHQAGTSYAIAAATTGGTTEYTLVTSQARGKKEPAPKPLKPLYDPNDQKVIIQLHPDSPSREQVQETGNICNWRTRSFENSTKTWNTALSASLLHTTPFLLTLV